MGFCRRCGDIVSGARCRCGGLPVAPVISWDKINSTKEPQDKWSRTYVSRERSPSRPRPLGPSPNSTGPSTTQGLASSATESGSPAKRFPRPMSSVQPSTSVLGDRISTHIAHTTSGRPPSPLKQSTILPAPESNIIPTLSSQTSSLSKVYGSVLQPKESLETHSCAICAADFPPDATIYPDPSDTSQEHRRFLCRACFVVRGGSKGACPECSRPVLILKSEGGFVYASGRYWHKKCFNCDGCAKNLGESPLVDLLGRPSCASCFDGCLKRGPCIPKNRREETSPTDGMTDNVGGMKRTPKEDPAYSSPALEELEQKLGILKRRESSPALEELEQRLSMIGKGRESPTHSPRLRRSTNSCSGSPLSGSPSKPAITDSSPGIQQRIPSPEREFWNNSFKTCPPRRTDTPSPVRSTRNSPAPKEEAIEEMKRRFLRGTSTSPGPITRSLPLSVTSPPLSVPPSGMGNVGYPPILASRIPRLVPLSTARRDDDDAPAKALSEADSLPPTPDLISDFSDVTTVSSGPDSPPQLELKDDIFGIKPPMKPATIRYSRGDFLGEGERRGRSRLPLGDAIEEEEGTPSHTPVKKINYDDSTPTHPTSTASSAMMQSDVPSKTLRDPVPMPVSDTQCCAHCRRALFSLHAGGRYVMVPDNPSNSESETKPYHLDCFKCYVCKEPFKESYKGQATFVKDERGPCHVECASPENVTVNYKMPQKAKREFPIFSVPPEQSTTRPTISTSYNSSRCERPPRTAPASQPTFPRFGSCVSCPGCRKSVSPMERGVVPGPQGTRWHASCLVCGGKKETKPSTSWILGRGEDKKKTEPGCGKKLDSAAKGDGEGNVWCRECWLMLPLEVRASPQVSPLRPTPTGGSTVATHLTGTTTLARQFTGVGCGDGGLIRQMTGGGISPTRHLSRSRSPTKQIGTGVEPAFRPRPKSVIGMRSTKSIDEGRGMFLVKQMTGGAMEA